MAVTTVGTLVASWGVDLQRGVDDHKFRNNSSYAPQALNPIPMRTATNLGFVDRLWRLFEPSGGSGFDNLDRHLIRKILLAQHGMSDPGLAADKGAIEHVLWKYSCFHSPFLPKSFRTFFSCNARDIPERERPGQPSEATPHAVSSIFTATNRNCVHAFLFGRCWHRCGRRRLNHMARSNRGRPRILPGWRRHR